MVAPHRALHVYRERVGVVHRPLCRTRNRPIRNKRNRVRRLAVLAAYSDAKVANRKLLGWHGAIGMALE